MGLWVIGVISFLMGDLASAIFGIPLATWLRRHRKLTAVPLCTAGALLGAVILAGINGWSHYWPEMIDCARAISIALQSAKRTALPGAFIGLACAAAFCFGAGIPMIIRSSKP